MTYNLKAFSFLQKIAKNDVDVDELQNYTENELKTALELIERFDEDLAYTIKDKLLDYSNAQESAYEDGEIVFIGGSYHKVNFWGFERTEEAPGEEEELFWSNISKIKEICL